MGAPGVPSQPNIVLLFADDFGWGDIGANWPETTETPNIDSMAAAGIRFTDFHAGASVCTPSRAALMTGRYGLRTGVIPNFWIDAAGGLPTNETTMGEVLKGAGYKTKMLGKWHLGQAPPFHPTYRGFDEYFGLPFSCDMGCIDVPNYNIPAQPTCTSKPSSSSEPSTDEPNYPTFPGVPLFNCTTNCSGLASCNDCILEQPVNLTTLSTRYAQSAQEFIQRASSATGPDASPFFLYVAFAHVHVPLAYDPVFANSSTRGPFGDVLRELDWTVGQILSALESTGVSNNTLVFFTGDNGPWGVKCELAGSQGPFKGEWYSSQSGKMQNTGKMTTWEGGHREPGIAYWPGVIKPRVTPALASTIDLLPTFAALANTQLPSDREYDGTDLSPVLFEGSDKHHTELYHPDTITGNLTAMRVENYKVFYLLYGAEECTHSQYYENMKAREHKHLKRPIVFDLDNDPGEAHPIDPDDALLGKIEFHLNKKLTNIFTTARSTADYKRVPSMEACCDVNAVNCMCNRNPSDE